MRRLTWGMPDDDELAAAPAPLVIQTADAGGFAAPTEDYIGSDYVRRVLWLPENLGQSGAVVDDAPAGAGARLSALWERKLYPWLRWAQQRRADAPLQAERVILWALRDGVDEHAVSAN
jgi:hypothetical protein